MITAIALTALRECLRRPLPYVAVAAVLTLMAASQFLHLFTFGAGAAEAANLAISAVLVAGLGIAMFTGTALVRADMERGTLALILSQPVGLTLYVLGRFAGLTVAILAVCALTAAGAIGLFALAGAPETAFLPMLLGWTRVAMAAPLLSAVALAASSATSRVFAPVCFLALFLAGDLSPTGAISRLVPSLGLFGLDAARATPLGWLVLYSGLYSVVFLMATQLLLALRPPIRTES